MLTVSSSRKSKQAQQSRLLIAAMLPVGFGIGYIFSRVYFQRPGTLSHLIIYIVFILLTFVFAAVAQIIIHELGHLIGGLLSGYRFLSFRVMSFVLVRDRDGFRLARYWLPGTGGQCLLEPPEYQAGNFPYKLYHIAGPGLNLLSAALFIGISFIVPFYPSIILQILALLGLYFGFTNGIPLKTDLVSNDGADLLTLGKCEAARKSFWTVLKANALQTQGQRLKDMPDEYFEPHHTKANYLSSMQAILNSDRYMDQQNFTGAAEVIDELVKTDQVMGIQRTLIQGDRIFIALVQGDLELAETLYKQEEDNLHKMRKQLPVLRTEYALAKILKKEEAEGLLDRYRKLARLHPYAGEVETENELVAILDII